MIRTGLLLLTLFMLPFYGQSQTRKPNIVLIVADDLGYSDLGCFGSEIATPNIDSLASAGRVFTSFYAAATCSPSRAMLLTGADHHVAGLGNMAERVPHVPEQVGQPGYEGYLNDRVVSVAALLRDAGYHTYMAGKWHLGFAADQSPASKGFERSFALLNAYANHFSPDTRRNPFREDDHLAEYPSGEYSSDLYTDKMIGFIDQEKDGNPFFLYAAYTAPHWPLQAPAKFINKYKGKYDAGYDELRTARLLGLKKMGLVSPGLSLPALPDVKGNLYDISDRPLVSWANLSKEEQKIEARKMEIYAAMIDNLDWNIGRLIAHLKKTGKYDNTVFVFISDNGADVFEMNESPDPRNPYPHMGGENSFIAYGPQWAHASSAFNRLYKGYSAEGGIHVPMIIKMPGLMKGPRIERSFCSVLDLVPTFQELAGVQYPDQYRGRRLTSLAGESLIPVLTNKRKYTHDSGYVMGWELFGRCALRKGKWKITRIEPPFGTGDFQLYDIENDPAESRDLAKKHPDIYQQMLKHWKAYVRENGVILPGR